MKRIISVLTLCTAMGFTVPAQAQGPDGPPPPAPPGGPAMQGGQFGMPPHMGMPGRGGPAHDLAAFLNNMETVIGINASQLDAWRQYTDALQAVMEPPRPPKPGKSDDVFAIPTAMAENLIEKAKLAQDLTAAIERLRKTLTPEQIERLKRFGPSVPPPPGMRGPHPRFLAGKPHPGPHGFDQKPPQP